MVRGSSSPTRYFQLSLLASVVVIGLKILAWQSTGSVGFLSDAMESGVNFVSALFGLWMVSIAQQPADQDHPHGHSKAEYFSSIVEGLLIFLAAALIVIESVQRLLQPEALTFSWAGLGFSVIASSVNLGVGLLLLRAGRQQRSMALQADGKHLLSDVWTTVGVIAGFAAATLTGWLWLDATIGLLMAAYIAKEGYALIQQSVHGLMDGALPQPEQEALQGRLRAHPNLDVQITELMTRSSGKVRAISFKLRVPSHWTVGAAHDLCDELEALLEAEFAPCQVFIHVEPQ